MAILVIAEHDNSTLKAATLNAVTAAGKIGGEVHLLVAGGGCAAVADSAAKVAGVSKVLLVDAPHYAAFAASNLAALVQGLAAGYSHIVAAATTLGKNSMPRLAAILDSAQISEIVAVIDANTFVRPIYAGNVLATVQPAASNAVARTVITFTASAFEAAGDGEVTVLVHLADVPGV